MSRPQYSIVTAPAIEPVTYDQMADHLRLDGNDDADYVAAIISVAREYVESVTGRATTQATFRVVADSWDALGGCGKFSLFRTPLVSVESVSYYGEGDTMLTLAPEGDYLVIDGTAPGQVIFTADRPAFSSRPDSVQIEFVAGHSDPAQVPAILRHCIKLLAAHLYENRVPVTLGGSVNQVPFTLQSMLLNQRVGGWFA